MRLNDHDLAAIRERADAATPGPWTSSYESGGDLLIERFAGEGGQTHQVATVGWCKHHDERQEPDAQFITCARTDIPALLAELDATRAELALRNAQVITLAAGDRVAVVLPGSVTMRQIDGVRGHLREGFPGVHFTVLCDVEEIIVYPAAAQGGANG